MLDNVYTLQSPQWANPTKPDLLQVTFEIMSNFYKQKKGVHSHMDPNIHFEV